MDNDNHSIQAGRYLREPLERFLRERALPAYVGSNSFVYYDLEKRACGPDFYVVNGGLEREQRQGSWVVWDEGDLYPTLIVELLSPTSEKEDRGSKMTRYEARFHAPDYYLYDTEDQRFEGYHLREGGYVRVLPDADGRIACQSLPLKLGVVGKWLRWFTLDGRMLLTGEELAAVEHERAEAERQRAEAERQRAEAERQRAEAERQRAEAAEARLHELERRLKQPEEDGD
ncbi:MAG: Uma2 family endonuclease [Candidatus Xenobia bacterium]